MLSSNNSIIALDVGTRRIGIAAANAVARLAHPLKTLTVGDTVMQDISDVLAEQQAAILVVGLPRNLSGNSTEQTRIIETFITELKQHTALPIFAQDEAATSVKAEQELQARGSKYEKGDIDALSAVYILEDFLTDHPEVHA